MKTILVATDFSDAALNAANYAADMAKSINTSLFLLHIYEIPVPYLEIPVMVDVNELVKDAQLRLDKLKQELIKRTDNKINIIAETKTGTFIQELQSTCENIKPYVTILGTQGTTAADHVSFGSRAVQAMKKLEWTLITVPFKASYSSIKKMALACDLKNVTKTIPVEDIKTLLGDFKSELHIINTGKKERFNADVVFESGILEEMLLKFKPQFHFIAADNIDTGIIDFVEKNNIDLLIALHSHRSLIESIIHKSHSKQFILHSHVPVMALPHN